MKVSVLGVSASEIPAECDACLKPVDWVRIYRTSVEGRLNDLTVYVCKTCERSGRGGGIRAAVRKVLHHFSGAVTVDLSPLGTGGAQ